MKDIKKVASRLQNALAKLREVSSNRPLSKNEIEASASTDGNFSLEFGADIPSELRKSAVQWLYGRGFSLLEDRGAQLSFKKAEKAVKDKDSQAISKRWTLN